MLGRLYYFVLLEKGIKMSKVTFLVGLVAISVITADTMALVPAFPGAEGEGGFATGGRGGDVYEVNNLNSSSPGSIVDAVSQGNRTIVFRVSGTIELPEDTILYPKSNTTIAGQTAPGDGICIKGRIRIGSVSNVVIRYIRVRANAGGANASGDAIDIADGNNIIIDHVTASYGRDETISCQDTSNNITVQWCILSEALTFPQLDPPKSHSYGSLIRGNYGDEKTYHHNLYAHNNGRNPRPGNETGIGSDTEGLHFDFRNNVMYNWVGKTAGYNDDGPGYVSRYNFIGNVYIPGPESTSTSSKMGFREKSTDAYGYFADNSYDGNVSGDPCGIVDFSSFSADQITAYKARSYLIPMEPVTTTSQAQAKTDVLANAGASFPKRDIIDTRIVNDVNNKTGHSIYDTNAQPEGGWPTLNSLPAPTDSDHDGMPDTWETLHGGLNPNDANDRNGYDLDANYTNLEVYLNGIMSSPSVPIGLTATAGYATVVLDWNNNNDSNLAGYNVYRSTTQGSGYSKLNGSLLSDSNYIDNTVPHDTTYYYIVTAVDINSNESGYSSAVFSGLYGDFTGNAIVEMNDLPDFLDYWLEDDCNETSGLDLDNDCIVNFYEFSVLAENWLQEP
jgi:pectate lyase